MSVASRGTEGGDWSPVGSTDTRYSGGLSVREYWEAIADMKEIQNV